MISVGDSVDVYVTIHGETNLDTWLGKVRTITAKGVEVSVPFPNGTWPMIQEAGEFTLVSSGHWKTSVHLKPL